MQHSRSRSPGGVSAATSAGDASWSPVRTDTAGFGTGFGTDTGGFGQQGGFDTGVPDFGTGSPQGQTSPGFGFPDSGFETSSPSSKKDRRNKDRHREDRLRDHGDRHRDEDSMFPDTGKTMSPTSLPLEERTDRFNDRFDFDKRISPRRDRDFPRRGDVGGSPDFGHRDRPRLPDPPRHEAPPVEH